MDFLRRLLSLTRACVLCGRWLRETAPPPLPPGQVLGESGFDPSATWRAALFCKRCTACQCASCAKRAPWNPPNSPPQLLWACGKPGCTGVLTAFEEVARRFADS